VSELAILTLSPTGFALGQRLARELGRGEVFSIEGSARQVLQDCFWAGRPLVCIMALGIVVRILGPLTRDKTLDPPVVVVDEAGRFAISVLGGHSQGANALAGDVAGALGGVPVISTASESLGLPAVDLIGREWGWKLEAGDNLTRLAAAVVRGDTIGVYQDAGRRDWYEAVGGWPETFVRVAAWPPAQKFAGLIVISDRSIALDDLPPVVLYRPPSLAL
jgi:Cobalamin synthesis G N-terminal/Cobalamin biosynthesis central region